MYSLAIDFGTSYTTVFTLVDGEIKELDLTQGKCIIPSTVAIGKELKFGMSATTNTLHCMKLLAGRRLDDLKTNGLDENMFGVKLREDNGEIWVDGRDSSYSVSQIITEFILYVVKCSKERLERELSSTLYLSVPVRFNSIQRNALVLAARNAGFDEVKLINEPTAAAVEYITENKVKTDETVLIYDLGGGTFDVSILRVNNQGRNISVLATGGDARIGGEKIDKLLGKRVMELCKERFKGVEFKDEKKNMKSYAIFYNMVREAKEACVTDDDKKEKEVSISVEDILTKKYLEELEERGESGDLITVQLTPERLKWVVKDEIDKSMDIVKAAIHRAFPKSTVEELASNITTVLPVGGGSCLDYVKSSLKRYFGEQKVKILNKPKWYTGKGCAEMMKGIQCKEICVRECTTFDIGFRCSGDKFERVIKKGTPIPLEKPVEVLFQTKTNCQTFVRTFICEGDDRDSTKINETFISDEIRIEFGDYVQEGKTKFYLSLSINENGIYQVKALSDPDRKLLWEGNMEMTRCYKKLGSKSNPN